jgi:hypothetical protein
LALVLGGLVGIIGTELISGSRPLSVEERAAKWIADVDGDCIFSSPPLTPDDVRGKFPRLDLDELLANTSLDIELTNGFLVSRRPNYQALCNPALGYTQAVVLALAFAGLLFGLRACAT